MTVTAPPAISALPEPPDPNDRSTFKTRAYPWSAAQAVLGAEVAAVSSNVYNNALAAAASGSAAEDAADAAAAAANYKGAWSALVGALNVPASVSHAGAVYILTASVADVTAHTPGVSANWLLLSPVQRIAICSAAAATRDAVSSLEQIENANPSGVVAGGGLSYGAGLFISDLPSSASAVYSSPDGTTWTARTMPTAGAWKVAFGNGAFVACIPGATNTAKSTDGITWSAGGTLPAAASANAVPIYAMGYWMIDTTGAEIAISSNNGGAWSSLSLPSSRGTGRMLLAGSTPIYWESGTNYRKATSYNTWALRTLPFTPSTALYAHQDFDGALLAGNQVTDAKIYRTTDGETWTDTGKVYGELACTINGIYAALGATLGGAMTWHNGESMVRRSKANLPAPDYTKRIAKNTAGTVFMVPSSVSGCVSRIAPGEAGAKKAAFT